MAYYRNKTTRSKYCPILLKYFFVSVLDQRYGDVMYAIIGKCEKPYNLNTIKIYEWTVLVLYISKVMNSLKTT